MRIYSEWFLRAGIAVIAVSAFSSVHAQSNESRMLLEVQAMRQEIAELRDLVERQQYELTKLKQANRQGGQPSNSPYSSGNYSNGTYGENTFNGATGGAPVASNVPAYNGGGAGSVPSNPNQAYQQPSQNNSFPSNDLPNTGAYQGGANNTYRPNPGNAGTAAPVIVESYPGRGPGDINAAPQSVSEVYSPNAPNTQANPSVNGGYNNAGSYGNSAAGVPVEERVISADEPANDVASNGVVPVPQSASTANNGNVPIQANLSEQDYYQQGFDLLKKAEHEQAVQVFQQQIARYPQGDLVDDAYYWIAESKYVNRDLDSSKQNFKTIIEQYKQSPRLPDAMLKTAYIEQEQGNVIEARILLQEIIQFHSRSNAAISAKNRLEDL